MRVSKKDIRKASERGRPGFWAERTIKKVEEEYKELYETAVYGEEGKKLTEESTMSMSHFIRQFGGENVSRVLGFIDRISKGKPEGMMRTAHFFYHLGRRHERSIFK